MNPLSKGTEGGTCNRTVCDYSPALHYNLVTQRFYCTYCASLIKDNGMKSDIKLFDWDEDCARIVNYKAAKVK